MNINRKIRRAPGFEDRSGPELDLIESILSKTKSAFRSRGYIPIETPLIEQTELFLRMSGGLLSSQMFDFTAPDGSNVCIRPEITASVIRYALEKPHSILPQRYQYAAPIVRYSERPYDASPKSIPSPRQFIQVGAELIGASQPAADGEIIAAAREGAKIGADIPVSIRVGHIGLIKSFLRHFELSERAQLFLADSIAKISANGHTRESLEDEAQRLGLMGSSNQLLDKIGKDNEWISRLISDAVELPHQQPGASRSADEILSRLKRKLDEPHDPATFRTAMRFISEISSVSGRPDQAVERINSTARDYGVDSDASLQNLAAVVDAACHESVSSDEIAVDIGLAAGIGYYTGMIFDISASEPQSPQRIGSGGRYDRLSTALGAETELPALGFALNLDAMLPLAADSPSTANAPKLAFVIPADPDASNEVAKLASQLRSDGYTAVSLFDRSTSPSDIQKQGRAAKIFAVSSQGNVETLTP